MGDGLPIPSDDGYPKGFLGKFKNGGGGGGRLMADIWKGV